MQIIDGRKLAADIRTRLKEKIAADGGTPHLAVVLAGDDEASLIYDRNKKKAAEEAGMICVIHHLSADVSQEEITGLVEKLNNDREVTGIIVQMPLPKHLDSFAVLRHISPEKDVDGFGVYNSGLLATNRRDGLIPATPKGILYMLQSTGENLSGKHAVIIGRSNIVGRPLASLLLQYDCTVTVTHSRTRNLAELARQADILVAACGKPKIVKKDWIKPGAIVIDVGINRVDGRLCGDVDFEEAAEKAAYLTPVPGGVGVMTVAMLLDNVWEAYVKQKKKDL